MSTGRRRSYLLLLALVGCSDPDPASGCETGEDCAAGERCLDSECVLDERCDGGACAERDAAPAPEDAARPSDGGPVDCSSVTANGWELCEASHDTCGFVFSDSTGCPAACARLGLVCGESFEDVDGACAADTSRPALSCEDTGHISDYCTCVRGEGPADAGTIDAAVPADGGAADAGMGSCPADRPWECLLDRLEGFGGAATGGAGGALCWVENLERRGAGSLQACLDAPGPRWVVFRVSGTVELGSVNVPSDTTLDGRGQRVTLRGGSSHTLNAGSNVVISNFFIEGAEYDLVHTWPDSSDVWLDHLTLTDAGDELLGLDGPRTTVSWCHLRDNGYATLVGGGARTYSDLWVTFHHNFFENNRERHPRTRGRVHSFNNVVRFGLSGGRVSFEGHLLSEHNIYVGDGSALISRAGGAVTVPGHYRSIDDVLRGGATLSTPNDPAPVFTATDHYAYTLDDADAALEARVEGEAGWQDVPLPLP